MNKTYEIGDKIWYEKNGIQQGEITDVIRQKNALNKVEYYVVLDYDIKNIKSINDIYLTKDGCESAIISKKSIECGVKVGDNVYFYTDACGMECGKISNFTYCDAKVCAEIDNGYLVSARTVDLEKLNPFEEITTPENLAKFLWVHVVNNDNPRYKNWAKSYAKEAAKKLNINFDN